MEVEQIFNLKKYYKNQSDYLIKSKVEAVLDKKTNALYPFSPEHYALKFMCRHALPCHKYMVVQKYAYFEHT